MMANCPGDRPWLTCPPHLTYEGFGAQSYGCSRCGNRVSKNELRQGTSIITEDEVRIRELELRIEELVNAQEVRPDA